MITSAQKRWLKQAVELAPIGIVAHGATGGLRHFVVVRMLNRLVARGLLERQHNTGNYVITQAGTEELSKAPKKRKIRW